MKNMTVVLMFIFSVCGGKHDDDRLVQKLDRTELFAPLIFQTHSFHHSKSCSRLGFKYSRTDRLFQCILCSLNSDL